MLRASKMRCSAILMVTGFAGLTAGFMQDMVDPLAVKRG